MKNKKRWISVLLSVCILLTMLPLSGITALAADDISYLSYENGNWQTKTQNGCTEITNGNTSWGTIGTESWYVAQGNITIGSRVTVSGDVHLILADGCTLNANSGGINVNSGSSLTIYSQSTDENAMGKLTATGSKATQASAAVLTAVRAAILQLTEVW